MLKRSLRSVVLCSALVAAAVGCSVGPSDSSAQTYQSITDVPQTSVKDQSIGNCWTYATTGWVESLVKIANGKDMNLSESYVNYWFWFDQVTDPSFSGTSINQGGSYGIAVEIMRKRGMMDEGAFIPEEADVIRSGRQESAVNAMNVALATGALKTPEARANAALVRQELNRAWGLSDAVAGQLDTAFGKDGQKTLITGDVPDGVPIHATKDLPAKLKNTTTGKVEDKTLADAIGLPAGDWDVEDRSGDFAWQQVMYPDSATDRRQFQKRVQRALHDNQPVVIAWYVDFNALDDMGRFLAPPAKPGSQGGHMTIIMDYQVTNVPGFGTLPAGVPETRPDALNAALDDAAVVQFVRIKNSWGNYHSVPTTIGYHDLYMDYMNGPIKECETDADENPILDQCHDGVPWGSVVLPAGY